MDSMWGQRSITRLIDPSYPLHLRLHCTWLQNPWTCRKSLSQWKCPLLLVANSRLPATFERLVSKAQHLPTPLVANGSGAPAVARQATGRE